MCERTLSRVAFGGPLARKGTILSDLALSRAEIEQCRLLTQHTARLMDNHGNKVARAEISMLKYVAPDMAMKVLDRAMQAHGAAGLSQDFPLAHMFVWARVLRLADGPDEVHRELVGRLELNKHKHK